MPYDTIGDLPAAVRDGLSPRCQDVWRRVFNETFDSTDGDEARANATAWAAGNNCMEETATAGGAMRPEYKHGVAHELKLDEQGAVTVAFAQLGVVDHDGDVTLPGAFPTKDVPMSAYGHTSWDGVPPIGRGGIREAGDWAVFAGQFLMETDHGRNAYHTVKAMAELQEWSYGYQPLEHSFGQQDGRQVRFLKQLEVYEVSPVLVGAGLGTHTLDIKAAGLLLSAGPAESFIERVDAGTAEMLLIAEEARKRRELRTKEGRVLSTANANRLSALAEALAEAADDLRELLESAEPAKQRAGQVSILIERLRLAGVDIAS